ASLTQHDVEVAALGDVLGSHEPFFDGGAHTPLEQHRLARVTRCLQQSEVLHVAGTDLKHVGVGGDQFDVGCVHDLGDQRQAGLVAHVGEDLQAFLTQALEGVGGSTRLVGTTAEQRRTRRTRHFRGLQGLFGCLHCAGTRDDGDVVTTDGDTSYAHDGAAVMVLPTDQLVGGRDAKYVAHTGFGCQTEVLEPFDVPDQADDGAADTAGHVGLPSGRGDQFDEGVDVCGGGIRCHDDDHVGCPCSLCAVRATDIGSRNDKEPRACLPGATEKVVRVSAARNRRPSGSRAGSHKSAKSFAACQYYNAQFTGRHNGRGR